MNDLFILHLSDLHFEPDKRDRNKALLKKITEDMKTIPDGKLVVVITGDVMAKGGVLRGKSKESLKPAKDFFKKFKEITAGKISGIFIVPGNHDKVRIPKNEYLIPEIRRRANYTNEKFDLAFHKAFWDEQMDSFKDSGYLEFVEFIFDDLYPELKAMKEVSLNTYGLYSLNIDGKKYCFALFNTAWSCQSSKTDNRHLVLGKFQTDYVIEEYHKASTEYDLTFALGHHPLDSLYGDEEDNAFRQLIGTDGIHANAYLCGHKHERNTISWSDTDNDFYTLMTGVGWEFDNDATDEKHYYSIYVFDLDLQTFSIFSRRTNKAYDFIDDDYGSLSCRPIHPQKIEKTINLSADKRVPYKKKLFATESLWETCQRYCEFLSRFSRYLTICKGYMRDNLLDKIRMKNGEDERPIFTPDEIDDFELYLNKDLYGEDEKRDRKIRHIIETYREEIYEEFESAIEQFCANFVFAVTEVYDDNVKLRCHCRCIDKSKTPPLYRNAFSYDNLDSSINPSEIGFTDLIEAVYKSEYDSMTYRVNESICKKKIKEKWYDFITIVPNNTFNTYEKRREIRYPILTFGVTVENDELENFLYCLDFMRFGNFIEDWLIDLQELYKISFIDFADYDYTRRNQYA